MSDSASNSTVRLPPHSTEMEMGVLGCILQSPNDCLGQCVERIKPGADVFYNLRHQMIYTTLVEMFNSREPIDIITLQQRLKDKGVLDQVGGIYYINELQDASPSSANLSYYTEAVLEKYTLRRILTICTETADKIYNHACTTDEFLDGFEKDALSIRIGQTKSTGVKELVLDAITDFEARVANKGAILGLSTNLSDLDRTTDGVHGGEMIVIAGFPSTGKTALAANIAFSNALNGIPVAFFTAEMTPMKIAARGMYSTARVNSKHVTELDFPRLTHAAGKISYAPIFIESASGKSITQITAIARRLKQKHNIRIIVVDYIQLISGSGDNREQEIASVSRGLKAMAIELDCAVLALSQLNDDGKLRESRAIGQDADSVYKLLNKGEWQPKVQPIDLLIEKCRDGETGKVELTFMKEYTRFENAAKISDKDNDWGKK